MNNEVELLGYYGGDKTHCLSAWTSTFKELDIDIPETIENRIDVIFDFAAKSKKKTPQELLVMLGEAGHHTPFEKSALHFLVTSDVSAHIHLIKHRIGVSINAESARYKELQEDKYYLPKDWTDIQATTDINHNTYGYNHKGNRIDTNAAGNVEKINEKDHPEKWLYLLKHYTERGNILYHQCLADLTPILGRKRAKESARFFKTYNSQITADVMFNFRSFMHFQGLRNSEHAQVEIREIAQNMLRLVKELPNQPFKDSLAAFGY